MKCNLYRNLFVTINVGKRLAFVPSLSLQERQRCRFVVSRFSVSDGACHRLWKFRFRKKNHRAFTMTDDLRVWRFRMRHDRVYGRLQ